MSKSVLPRLVHRVRLDHVAPLRFWAEGASWNRREASQCLDALRQGPE